MLNYFRIMGLGAACSPAEIKAAYRRLAKEHHPDNFATADESDRKEATVRFQAIAEAYRVLSNPYAREAYENEFRDLLREDLKFLCDSCAAVNRITKRLPKDKDATCGKCGSVLSLTERDWRHVSANLRPGSYERVRREARVVAEEIVRAGLQIIIRRYVGPIK